MVGGVSNPDRPNTRFGEFGQNRIYEIHCKYMERLDREVTREYEKNIPHRRRSHTFS